MKLSRLAISIPGSGILAISNAIKERVRKGAQINNFTVGDFDPSIFPIPSLLESEIIKAYQTGQTNYPMAEGNLDLREAISRFILKFQGLYYEPDRVLVAAGGRPLIYTAYEVIVDPGDVVIYAVPSWNNQYYCQFTQARTRIIETVAENNFMPTAAEIKPFIKEAVLLALCSPQNPTGTFFTKEQLTAICEMVVAENKRRGDSEKKLYILYDHIYHLLTYSNSKKLDPVTVCPAIKPYTIYIDAISKGFAATGVRVGWAYGPEHVISKMKAVLSHVGAWAPMAEQKGVAAFLNNENAVTSFLIHFKRQLKLRLEAIYSGILKMKEEGLPVDAIEPKSSIYISIKIDIPGDACLLLLENAGIAILPFPVFGAGQSPNWYRLSIGTCRFEDIPPMLHRLQETLEKSVSVIQ